MVSVSLVSLLSVITIFRLTQCNFGFTCVFYSLIVSHAPLPSIGVAGTQESPFTERVLCPYTHTQMHKTHPHWNKHNPPAPLSWVTLLKQNNNDRVQGGDLCVCVCPLMKNTQTRKLNWIPTLLITDCLGAGWRSELDQRRSSVYREEQLRSATRFSQILWQCISNVMLQLIKLVNMSYFSSSLSKNVSQIFLT